MDARALMFRNLLNGVPEQQVAEAFRTSVEEVQKVFAFVLLKVKGYCFLRQTERGYPVIMASTVESARKYKLTCLEVLPKLNLNKDAVDRNGVAIKDIQSETLNPDNIMTVSRNLNT